MVYYSARPYPGPGKHAASRECRGDLRDGVLDGRQNRCRALARRSRIGAPPQDRSLGTDETGGDLRTADIYPRFGPTNEWDTAAGQGVLEAAGGEVVTTDGRPLSYGKPGFGNPHFIARCKGAR